MTRRPCLTLSIGRNCWDRDHGNALIDGPALHTEPLAAIASRVAAYPHLPDAPAQLPIDHRTAKYGVRANGYGLDQNLSADKARQLLRWTPAVTTWG